MPPKRKKGGAKSKKKSDRAKTRASRGNVSAASTPTVDTTFPTGQLPSLHGTSESAKATSLHGVYEIYKKATHDFWEWMRRAVPEKPVESVSGLSRAADHILEHNTKVLMENLPETEVIAAPSSVLRALRTSIRNRKMFTQKFVGGGDAGHRYIVELLEYCHGILKFSRQVAHVLSPDHNAVDKEELGDEADENINAIGGRFAPLIETDEDDEDDTQVTDDDLRRLKIPSFQPPPDPPANVSVEDLVENLLHGDDRFQAVCLLQTMDSFMSMVDAHYGLLKNHLRGQDTSTANDNTVKVIMECAAVANLATETVRVIENSLAVQHPHLSSFYHVIALVFMPEPIASLHNQINPTKLVADPHMALSFVASLIESAFHNKGEGDKIEGKIKRFVRKSGVPYNSIEEVAKGVHMITTIQIMLHHEERHNPIIRNPLLPEEVRPHSWLDQYGFIGGPRCILNTQRLLQTVMDALADNTKLVPIPGFWGKEFEEDKKPAAFIRGDLDEAFCSCIVPELIEICRRTPFSVIPERSQLVPVLDTLYEHLKGGRTRPIPVALSFGMHAMLTSILVIQGSGDLMRVASLSKRTFNQLFRQLDQIADGSKSPMNSPNFYLNVRLYKTLRSFAKPLQAKIPRGAVTLDLAMTERMAFWNPVIGGGYLLLATELCSIGLGSATIDSLGQLRISLHIYNMLKHVYPSMEIPLLDLLESTFASTKAVWVTGRSQAGSFAKSFWVAWGMSFSEAQSLASDLDSSNLISGNHQAQVTRFVCVLYHVFKLTFCVQPLRQLVAIEPEDFSDSYRRIVLHDFTDEEEVAKFTSLGTVTEHRNDNSLFDLMTRINIARDSMDSDGETFLPYNLPAVGCVLLEFCNALATHMVSTEFSMIYPVLTGKNLASSRIGIA